MIVENVRAITRNDQTAAPKAARLALGVGYGGRCSRIRRCSGNPKG